jgi:hypothetical protein
LGDLGIDPDEIKKEKAFHGVKIEELRNYDIQCSFTHRNVLVQSLELAQLPSL